MKDKKPKAPRDKNGKLSTYVVVMLLSIIIIIIIAAMADNREQKFQNQIDSTTQANMTIQNEIVAIKDENYFLKQEKEKTQKEIDVLSSENAIFYTLNDSLKLLKEDKLTEATEKFAEINADSVPESCRALYDAVESILKDAE